MVGVNRRRYRWCMCGMRMLNEVTVCSGYSRPHAWPLAKLANLVRESAVSQPESAVSQPESAVSQPESVGSDPA